MPQAKPGGGTLQAGPQAGSKGLTVQMPKRAANDNMALRKSAMHKEAFVPILIGAGLGAAWNYGSGVYDRWRQSQQMQNSRAGARNNSGMGYIWGGNNGWDTLRNAAWGGLKGGALGLAGGAAWGGVGGAIRGAQMAAGTGFKSGVSGMLRGAGHGVTGSVFKNTGARGFQNIMNTMDARRNVIENARKYRSLMAEWQRNNFLTKAQHAERIAAGNAMKANMPIATGGRGLAGMGDKHVVNHYTAARELAQAHKITKVGPKRLAKMKPEYVDQDAAYAFSGVKPDPMFNAFNPAQRSVAGTRPSGSFYQEPGQASFNAAATRAADAGARRGATSRYPTSAQQTTVQGNPHMQLGQTRFEWSGPTGNRSLKVQQVDPATNQMTQTGEIPEGAFRQLGGVIGAFGQGAAKKNMVKDLAVNVGTNAGMMWGMNRLMGGGGNAAAAAPAAGWGYRGPSFVDPYSVK